MTDVNKQKFYNARDLILNSARGRSGIGTLAEKTLHAVLKLYFEPDMQKHEIKLGGYFADIFNEEGIIEIQTRDLNKLRRKLVEFLEVSQVTVVYPIPQTKWLCWIDAKSGSVTKKRKSPRTGTPYDAFAELYKIKPLLNHQNLRICLVLLDLEEYRNLDGWSRDKKKGSSRFERIPVDIADEIYLRSAADYARLVPETLPASFTSKDFAKAAKINISRAQTALNVLSYVNAVVRTGKQGNFFVYKRSE